MRLFFRSLLLLVSSAATALPGYAQEKPKLLEIDGFMAKGAFTELDPERAKHRLSLEEIVTDHLNGEVTDITDILRFMANQEKMRFRVEEPLEVRGEVLVSLPPNTMGDEAYTTCFYALSFNGLVVAGSGDELVLVRPETRPALERPRRPWNRKQVLSTQLFRLGYLEPDPILRQYRDQIGTAAGQAVLEKKSNLVIVGDTAAALAKLREHIDSEILQAMGVPAAAENQGGEELRPPTSGAIASRESIHFYLLAYARMSQIPLAPAESKGVFTRRYPEADVWTDERGYRALENEYRRVNEFARFARRMEREGPNEPVPGRTLSPAAQRRLAIHYGVVSSAAARPNLPKNKRTVRKR